MSEAKHTPGPWVWDGELGSGCNLKSAHGDVISHFSYEGMHFTRYDGEDAANARLIAAAPELLQALQLLHDDIAEYARINNLGGFDNHCMRLARAAINKATGAA